MTFTDTKDPNSVVDFHLDWSDLLSQSEPADTLATSTWTADAGVTVDSDSNDDTTTTVWVSGGNINQICKLTNAVSTAGGRTYNRTIALTLSDL